MFLFTRSQLITHLILQKLHSKQKLDSSNSRAARLQKRHVGVLISVTTRSHDVFAGIEVKLTGELSVNLS